MLPWATENWPHAVHRPVVGPHCTRIQDLFIPAY